MAALLLALSLGGLLSCGGGGSPADGQEAPTAAENMQIARAQRVGAPPVGQLAPTAVPRGLRPEAVRDAPTNPVIGGPIHVAVYGAPRRDEVLVAVAGVDGPAEDERIPDVTTIGRQTADERWIVVQGRGLPRRTVVEAAQHARSGQRAAIEPAGLPDGFEELASGDVWSGLGLRGGHLLGGSLLRYSSPSGDQVLQISMARGGARLLHLARAAVAPDGRLAFEIPSAGTVGIVRPVGEDVVVVSARGLSRDDVPRVMQSLAPVDTAGWSALRAAAATFAPQPTDGFTTLFEGGSPLGTWRFSTSGGDTRFETHAVDGGTTATSGSIAVHPRDVRRLTVDADAAIGEGRHFMGGVASADVVDIRFLYDDGSSVPGSLRSLDKTGVQFFGAALEGRDRLAAVAALGASGEELSRISL